MDASQLVAKDLLGKGIGKQILKDAENLPGFGLLVATFSMYASRWGLPEWAGGLGKDIPVLDSIMEIVFSLGIYLLIVMAAYACWLIGDQLDDYFFKMRAEKKNAFEWTELKKAKGQLAGQLNTSGLAVGPYDVSAQIVKAAKGTKTATHRLLIYLVNQTAKYLRSMAVPWLTAACVVAAIHAAPVLAAGFVFLGAGPWFLFVPLKKLHQNQAGSASSPSSGSASTSKPVRPKWVLWTVILLAVAAWLALLITALYYASRSGCEWAWIYCLFGATALPISLLLKRGHTHYLYWLTLSILREPATPLKHGPADNHYLGNAYYVYRWDGEIIVAATLEAKQEESKTSSA